MESNQYGEHTRRAILHRGIISSPKLTTDAQTPFFNYGLGFFETILFENGKLHLFEEHINRMKNTCRDFGVSIDYNEIHEDKILEFLKKSNLFDHCCRIKILYSPIEFSNRWDTIVTASPYTRPGKDFTLSIHNEVYDSKLNNYKSLNYQYNLYWKNHYHKTEHSDEVMFCNKDGNILEGSYTNILYRKGSTIYYVDIDNNYLKGIMQDKILEIAPQISDIKIQSLINGIEINHLKDADEVMICNSLMKVQNVIKIIKGKDVYKWSSSPSSNYLTEKLKELIL